MNKIGNFYKCLYCDKEATYFGYFKLCGKHYKRGVGGISNIEDFGNEREYNEYKLSLTRNNRNWEDNIRSRRIVEKNGKKMVVYKTRSGAERAMPTVPIKLRQDPNYGKLKK